MLGNAVIDEVRAAHHEIKNRKGEIEKAKFRHWETLCREKL